MSDNPKPGRGSPRREPIEGRYGRLEPLDAARHGPSLYAAVAGDDSLWDYMAYGPFAGERAFVDWLMSRQDLPDPLTFAVCRPDGECLGLASLMELRPAMGVGEVGHILYSPRLQRTALASEAIYLFGRRLFDDLGYRRYEWKCNAGNAASRRAAERFGFTFEGVFRQHQIVKGRNRDTAWFSMLDSEWPTCKAAFERWLEPSNFDAEGRQKTPLDARRR